MKAVLFCANPYAFGILHPLYDQLLKEGHEVLWYVPEKISASFPLLGKANHTKQILTVYAFKGDAIFVPGNEVPHYLRGVKVQVFHGLAGEKQGHFRIRDYFDLYLTQGPYFTQGFLKLAKKYKNFEVKETGWCKLDPLYQHHEAYQKERDDLLSASGKKNLVLYAPTFSPSLTSALTAKDEIFELADREDVYLFIKFHDLMDKTVVEEYRKEASLRKNVEVVDDRNILRVMIMADVMVSDTSSVVYEFTLLNKPVVTIRSTSPNITWCDLPSAAGLRHVVMKELKEDGHRIKRNMTIQQYHPYVDGQSSSRMIAAVEEYMQHHGVPEKRKLNLYRRFKMNKMFGYKPE